MSRTPASDAEAERLLLCNCYGMESTKYFRATTGEIVHWQHCQIYNRPDVSLALATRDTEIARLRAALETARDTFTHYGDLHAAKPDETKAERNYNLARIMNVALAKQEGDGA